MRTLQTDPVGLIWFQVTVQIFVTRFILSDRAGPALMICIPPFNFESMIWTLTIIKFSHILHTGMSSSSDVFPFSLILGFFQLGIGPYTMGIWMGGCFKGSKSILYSSFNQRIVSGSLFQGPTRSISVKTRKQNSTLFSDDFFLATIRFSLRLTSGCCHAHSN